MVILDQISPFLTKIVARALLDLWLDTFFGLKWPKCSFQALDPKFQEIFKIS